MKSISEKNIELDVKERWFNWCNENPRRVKKKEHINLKVNLSRREIQRKIFIFLQP
jgi:hypothetical protein